MVLFDCLKLYLSVLSKDPHLTRLPDQTLNKSIKWMINQAVLQLYDLCTLFPFDKSFGCMHLICLSTCTAISRHVGSRRPQKVKNKLDQKLTGTKVTSQYGSVRYIFLSSNLALDSHRNLSFFLLRCDSIAINPAALGFTITQGVLAVSVRPGLHGYIYNYIYNLISICMMRVRAVLI